MTFKYTAVVTKDGKQFWAEMPILPGTEGVARTFEDAVKDVHERAALILAFHLAAGYPIPWGESWPIDVDDDQVKVSVLVTDADLVAARGKLGLTVPPAIRTLFSDRAYMASVRAQLALLSQAMKSATA